MNREARVEKLSAYLDDELPPEEREQVEEMLAQDAEIRRQLEGMRSTVADLKHLERLAPPPTLGQDVARRIALAGEKRSLLDRVEDGLGGFGRQSNTFLMFAVIFALAAIMYFFAHGLSQRNQGLPVTFGEPPGGTAEPGDGGGGSDISRARTVVAAGRLFHRSEEGVWIEDGLGAEQVAAARPVDLGSDPDLLRRHPELRGVGMLGHAVVKLEGEILELKSAEDAVWVEPKTGLEFALLPAGRFVMGSPPGEAGREDQEVEHEVTIPRPFYLGRHEVTQRQWQLIMGENPSAFGDCERCPVENVNWHQVQEFIRRLEAETGHAFRLPTEAEWEYACRAGTTTPFHTGENLTTDEANYDGRYPYGDHPAGIYREQPTPVGSFEPNRWGLYDMHGNVWEWLQDEHCPYAEGPLEDPVGRCGSELQVIRGGSWYFNADSARCSLRYTHRPQDLGPSLGFRLARDAS